MIGSPAKKLAPPNGTMDRVRLQESLHFIATELHKGMSPLYNPTAGDDFKKSLKERLAGRWTTLAEGLARHLDDELANASGERNAYAAAVA